MMTITLEFDRNLHGYTDEFLAALWHAAQAQNKPFGDKEACEITETIGREIIRRFVTATPPALYHFQGGDVAAAQKIANAASTQHHRDFYGRQCDPSAPAVSEGTAVDGALIVFLDEEYRKEGWRALIPEDLQDKPHVIGWSAHEDILANTLHFTEDEKFKDGGMCRAPYSGTSVQVTSLRNLLSGWRHSPPATPQLGRKAQSRDPA